MEIRFNPIRTFGLLAIIILVFLESCAAWPLLTGAVGLAAGKKGGGFPLFFLGGSSASLDRIEISASATNLAKGTTIQLFATAIYSDDTNADVTSSSVWSTTDASTIQTMGSGNVKGESVGSASVTALYNNKSAQVTLTVTPATLSTLTISCTNQGVNLPLGNSRQCTLTGVFSDASSQDLTSDSLSSWNTGNSTIATIDSNGLVTANQVGATTIQASYNGINASSISLTVSSATLSSISISPTNTFLPLGKTENYTATGIYSDSSSIDLTDQVTWASSDTSVAVILNTGGSQGFLSTEAEGTSQISASLGAVNASTQLTVTEAILESITITAPETSIAKGYNTQLTATGIFTDSSTSNITTQVTWSSDNTSVVTVDNGSGLEGRVTATGVGSTTIRATIGGVEGTLAFTVTAAELLSIAVYFDDSSIAKGTSTYAEATGTYSDGTTQNLSSSVSWTTSNSSRVQLGSLTATPKKTLLSPSTGTTGTAVITAASGSISGQSTLTVTSAALVSIQVDPTNPSIALGLTQSFTATGTYTDSSTQDLTTLVTWNSANTSVATISNSSGTNGLANSVSQGTSNITATLSSIVSPPSALTVGAATLVSISIAPSPTTSIAKGLTVDFTATGTYTNGSTSDLTTQVTWSSSNTTYATISNANGSRGRLTSLLEGSTDVTASLNSITSSATSVTVTAATLQSIQVTPSNSSLAKGLTSDYIATGVYTDGNTVDLSTQATWSSSNTSVASVSNASGFEGKVSANVIGSATISALYSSITGSTTLTVTSATLVSIAISPSSPSVYTSLTTNLFATGTYTDGSTQDLTSLVTWSSADSAVATVSNVSGNQGTATGVASGSVTVSATYSSKTGTISLQVLQLDTTSPTVSSATSLSPTTVRVTFSESVNLAQATTASNYTVALSSAVTGSCSSNSNFTGTSSALAVSSVSGSGSIYTLTLSSSQNAGTSYTVVVNKSGIQDLSASPNYLGCSNYADFTGQEQLKVSSASCGDTNSIIVNFSKAIQSGSNVSGSAECSGSTECAYRYSLSGTSSLGDVTSAKILDGIVCGGASADSGKVCLTHSLLQTGSAYTVIAANAADGDSFDNTTWGSIRDSANTENVQPSPRDRATFLGCGTSPVNFSDGPLLVDPYGSTFGYLIDFNSKIYAGPNNAGNGALRFNYDGSSPESLQFSFVKDTTNQYTNVDASGIRSGDNLAMSTNTATTRESSIAVPPFVTQGHFGCTINDATLTLGCGPDNENGRGTFAAGTLGSTPYLFLAPARTRSISGEANFGTTAQGYYFDYVYYSSDSDASTDFKYIDLGAISGQGTAGATSLIVANDRMFVGMAKVNYTNNSNNSPDLAFVSFNSADTYMSGGTSNTSSANSHCTAGSNCDVDGGGGGRSDLHGRRVFINAIPYFGGVTFADNYGGGTGTSGTYYNTSPNWGYYLGVDSTFLFNGYIYMANGGAPAVGHNGSIVRATTTNPTTPCYIASSTTNTGCPAWREIAPGSSGGSYRSGFAVNITSSTAATVTGAATSSSTSNGPGTSNSKWHNSPTNNWFSLELRDLYDLIPADKAFPMWATWNSKLYTIRNVCIQSTQATGFELAIQDGSHAYSPISGCTDGTTTNRMAQLWKCDPTNGGADTTNPLTCESGEWSVVGDDGTGVTNFGDSTNKVITMIVNNGNYLYVGFDNSNGVRVYRTNLTDPGSASSSWTQIGGNGFGDSTNIQQIFSAVSVTKSGINYIYVSAGKNGVPLRVYRQQN